MSHLQLVEKVITHVMMVNVLTLIQGNLKLKKQPIIDKSFTEAEARTTFSILLLCFLLTSCMNDVKYAKKVQIHLAELI